MGASDQHQIIATLFLSVLSVVLIVGMVLTFGVIQWVRRRQMAELEKPPQRAEPERPLRMTQNLHHAAYKRPDCWLAIKHKNPLAVQQALALHNPKPCSWAEGLLGSGAQKLFVSPPVSGWILVIGEALPEPSDDVDVCFRFLLELSRKLGQVQYYSANSMLNYHAWAQLDTGRVQRAYAWAGITLWNQGNATQAESELKLKCYNYGESPEGLQYGSNQSGVSNADKVHLLAARWSIDPEEIDDRFIEREWGIVGEPSRRF